MATLSDYKVLIPTPFASSGDTSANIPTSSTSAMNWTSGFPAIFSKAVSDGGKYVQRTDFNTIFNAMSKILYGRQLGAIVEYESSLKTKYLKGSIIAGYDSSAHRLVWYRALKDSPSNDLPTAKKTTTKNGDNWEVKTEANSDWEVVSELIQEGSNQSLINGVKNSTRPLTTGCINSLLKSMNGGEEVTNDSGGINESNIVHRKGAETITGSKTFTALQTFGSTTTTTTLIKCNGQLETASAKISGAVTGDGEFKFGKFTQTNKEYYCLTGSSAAITENSQQLPGVICNTTLKLTGTYTNAKLECAVPATFTKDTKVPTRGQNDGDFGDYAASTSWVKTYHENHIEAHDPNWASASTINRNYTVPSSGWVVVTGSHQGDNGVNSYLFVTINSVTMKARMAAEDSKGMGYATIGPLPVKAGNTVSYGSTIDNESKEESSASITAYFIPRAN